MASRPSKLVFKGSKTSSDSKSKKKRKRLESEDDNAPSEKKITSEEGWMKAEELDHIEGPCLVVFAGTPVPGTGFCPTASSHFILKGIEEYGHDPSSWNVDEYEPTDVHQVLVMHQLPRTGEAEERLWTIKSAEGKYLSADKYGTVAFNKTAVGATEQWKFQLIPDAPSKFSIQNVWGQYLKVDNPKNLPSSGNWILRCDSESVGFCESFECKVQRAVVMATIKMRKLESKGRTQAVVDEISVGQETELLKKYQSWGGGRVVASNDKKSLMKAQKEGKLAEVLLERRIKTKSDKYCK